MGPGSSREPEEAGDLGWGAGVRRQTINATVKGVAQILVSGVLLTVRHKKRTRGEIKGRWSRPSAPANILTMFILISRRLCRTSEPPIPSQTYFKVSITGSKSFARLTKVGQISRDGTWEVGTPPGSGNFTSSELRCGSSIPQMNT